VDVLDKIIQAKRARVEASKREVPEERLVEQAIVRRRLSNAHTFVSALKHSPGVNIIAEFKRRSPSKGGIRNDVEPAELARSYQSGGAKAISVLTEQDHFAGSLDDLGAVREAVSSPVLRKDFVFDQYQVYETAARGADALLLIVAALDDYQLEMLRRITEEELGLDALVEVHNEEEMTRAVAAGSKLIGVNNRNLRTFEVSLETSFRLAASAPEGTTLVSESGLNSASDLRRLQKLGFDAFLIGESLMRAEDPESALRALISKSLEPVL
jgi:indole-3-glycerol phosphate synthase